jgi:HSP20 family protein
MLMRTDPFRELDRLLAQQQPANRAAAFPMPMTAYRQKDTFFLKLDLPGVAPGSIDLTVEKNVLTVRAERYAERPDDVEVLVDETPQGVFSRQVFLGETLDADNVTADYSAGVLTLSIPVHEQAKPRKVTVTSSEGSSKQHSINAA